MTTHVFFPSKSSGVLDRTVRLLLLTAVGFYLFGGGISASAQDQYEFDNLPFLAPTLSLRGVPQFHTLAPRGDFDFIKFTLDRTETIYFDFDVLELAPKPLIGFGLFASNVNWLDTPEAILNSALYVRLTEDTEEFGPIVPTVQLGPGTYYGIVVFLTCKGNAGCNPTPAYRISATILGGPDRWEPDNSPADARWIDVNGQSQVHDFISPTDEDWIAFYNPAPNMTLTITALHLGALASPSITLYESDGTTPIVSSDQVPGREKTHAATELEYVTTPADVGILYINAVSGTPGTKDSDTSFAISVKSSGGILPGALVGVVTHTGGGGCSPAPPIPNATVEIVNLGNVSTVSDATGAYVFAGIPADTYTVTASATGFRSVTKNVTVSSATATLDFALPSVKMSAAASAAEYLGDALVIGFALAAVRITGRRIARGQRRIGDRG